MIVSDDTNPAQSAATPRLTYYYAPPQGTARSTWHGPRSAIHTPISPAPVRVTTRARRFNFSGPVSSPPGYTTTVTETDSETFAFDSCSSGGGGGCTTTATWPVRPTSIKEEVLLAIN